MKKRKYFAILFAMCLLTVLLGICFANAANAESDSALQDKSFHRVISRNNDGLLRFTYEDAAGNAVEARPLSANAAASKRNLLRQQENLPDCYDPRGTEKETPIRDQTDTGSCWAFGAMKSLEGNAVAQGLYSLAEADFSENHLVWYTYHNLTDVTNPLYGDYPVMEDGSGRPLPDEYAYDMGGNAIFASFVLANGWGPVPEGQAPFLEAAAMASAMRTQPESFRWQSEMQMTDADCFDDATKEEIKQEILQNGALSVSLYYPVSSREKKKYFYEAEGVSSLYQNDKDPEKANHCVTIVGWDDDFDLFQQSPKEKGAWLIANSYGIESNDGGYFWVSYEDSTLCEFYSFRGVAADTYDTAYQYDGFGWNEGFVSDEDIAAANVFTNQEESAQSVSAVGFYTYADGQDYEINVYRRVGKNGPIDGEWVGRCTSAGTQQHSGYHTVQLAEPIAVAPGEKFSVIVTFSASSGQAYAVLEGADDLVNGYHYNSRVGESYLFLKEDNSWYDTAEESVNNVCVKAFANDVSEAEYQEQEKSYMPSEGGSLPWSDLRTPATVAPTTAAPTAAPIAMSTPAAVQGGNGQSTGAVENHSVSKISGPGKIVLGKGEKLTLPIQTQPHSGKSILHYRSSNTAIVTVNAKGRIHAKKTGSAKVIITAPSGIKKQLRIQVKKAPKSVQLTAKKTTLKVGKTVKLKVKCSKNSASYALKFVSKNKKVASVSDNGTVKAKKAGTAKIQGKTFNNKKGSIKIKVVR